MGARPSSTPDSRGSGPPCACCVGSCEHGGSGPRAGAIPVDSSRPPGINDNSSDWLVEERVHGAGADPLDDNAPSIKSFQAEPLNERQPPAAGTWKFDEADDLSSSNSRYQAFVVELRKTRAKEMLGCRVTGSAGGEFLEVTEVHNVGCIKAWNMEHPDQKVVPGARIVGINGTPIRIGDANAMMAELLQAARANHCRLMVQTLYEPEPGPEPPRTPAE
mmetsp:Transcript_44066/g.80511  ORF Transcript_44066/g.80511 Transcript_44066/m.80511 type:complete len:219 (-) Transcript_44066:54-710(-)